MALTYPTGLPLGLASGASYQSESPTKRSPLINGRAIVRRKFKDVPEIRSISWLFKGIESAAFRAWVRDSLNEGVDYFYMPMQTDEGFFPYLCRFKGDYRGPVRAGPDLWSISAELEMIKRSIAPDGEGLFPEEILGSKTLDTTMNKEWSK